MFVVEDPGAAAVLLSSYSSASSPCTRTETTTDTLLFLLFPPPLVRKIKEPRFFSLSVSFFRAQSSCVRIPGRFLGAPEQCHPVHPYIPLSSI